MTTTQPKRVQTITKQTDGSLSIAYTDGSQGTLEGNDKDDLLLQAAFLFCMLQGEPSP